MTMRVMMKTIFLLMPNYTAILIEEVKKLDTKSFVIILYPSAELQKAMNKRQKITS